MDTAIENVATELHEETTLSKREAEVYALKEAGLSRAEIAEELNLSPSTVSEYQSRIKTRLTEARRTIERVEL